MDVEIDPKTGILHAYAKIFDNSWYPHSPGFLPTAVVGASPLGKGSAVVGVEHGGRYHAALRLKPEDVAELNRVGRDATGDRIFFKVLKVAFSPTACQTSFSKSTVWRSATKTRSSALPHPKTRTLE